MNEIRRVLKIAAWRLLVLDLFKTLALTTTAAVIALIGVLLAERIFGLDVQWPATWLKLFGAAAGSALVAAVLWSAARRARGVAVARALDERANLRESLSTALCVAKSQDPWDRMVVETARTKAVGVKVSQAIPYAAPRLWPMPFACVLALAVLWFSVPTWDVLGLFNKRQTANAQKDELKQVSTEVKKDEQKLNELLEKAKVELKNEEGASADTADANKPLTPDELRRLAVKKLTSTTEKLNDLKNSDKAKQLEAIKQAMKQLKQPGPGPLDNMVKSMQKGDFQKAQKDLEELSKQLANSSMSEQDKQQAQKQMEKLAEQLKKAAESREEMQKKLEQAGMSKEQAKQAAANPESLQKALDEMKNMSDAEKKELMKQLAAKMSAAKQCESMSESMSKMAKGMGKNGMNQEGQQGMEGMSGQLSEMEMMSKDMEGLDAAMDEAMRQLAKMGGQCNGSCEGDGELAYKETASPWKAGESNRRGGGRGGPGQSGGSGRGDEEETPVSIEKTKVASKLNQGPIIGSTLVHGDQVRGESVAEFQSAVEASTKAATEALETMQVPRELHNSVKHYFGRLEARSKAQGQTPAPAGEKK